MRFQRIVKIETAYLVLLFMLVQGPAVHAENTPDPHSKVYQASQYPSAEECAPCHRQIYDEWRSSAHAYASISPVFHKFEQAISTLSSGTIGTFCVRCHATVSTTIGEPREMPIWERKPVSREGVTCITCHRIDQEYNKANGERRVVPGDVHAPVYGSTNAQGLDELLKEKAKFKIASAPGEKGRKVHAKAIKFEQLTKSEFCVSCHQVAVAGIKLEVVWEQYRDSPARKAGISCQDCHMGSVQGQAKGYDRAPAAVIRGKKFNPNRRHANHTFVGPGYPIVHPGLFPHNIENQNFSVQQWLTFDYRAGWGTESFEALIASGRRKVDFPKAWGDPDKRKLAASIIQTNRSDLAKRMVERKKLMDHSVQIDGPFFTGNRKKGSNLDFHYTITNRNSGHSLPSGSLGAQPELWLNVALIDPDGKNVWESGYIDSHGDMADLHSLDVRAGKLPRDAQLFNLQTKFLTTNVKGTDREMYLPVSFDVDPLPFIRPATVPTGVLNHPPFVRMEGRSIPPLGNRDARYSVPSSALKKRGRYRLAVRMRSRAEPMYFMKFIGATPDMLRAMNEGILDISAYTVEFEVK